MEDLENKDNKTKYGEFVCSEFKWLPIEKQKENKNGIKYKNMYYLFQ